MGQTFEVLLKHFRSRFEALRDKSLRYNTHLLLHGGIPIFILNGFFEFIVLPNLQKSEYIRLTGQKLIDEMLERFKNQVNKPVQYFPKFGGETEAIVLSRSRKLAKVWLEDKEKFDAEMIGLPSHVVDAFYNWIIKNSNQISKTRTTSRQRIETAFDD